MKHLDVSASYCPPADNASKVRDTVALCRQETGSDKVLLVAHSAGGWLARAALGYGHWEGGMASEDVISGTRSTRFLRKQIGMLACVDLCLAGREAASDA